jgi:hypothetical protein
MYFGCIGATSDWQQQWFLRHDNVPSHTSLVMQQFLAEKDIPVITQPPCSPDLAQSDFWLFPTPKMGLKGICRNHGGHKKECDGDMYHVNYH